MPTQREIAEHLDMSERNARDVLKGLGLDGQSASLDEIRTAYIRDMRAKAAGRGGSMQDQLNASRIEELQVKSANGRLAYHEKLGALVNVVDVEMCLTDWAAYANREYQSGLDRIIEEIESTHRLAVDRSVVTQVAGSTAERIAGYAAKLGESLVGGGG